MGLPRDSFLKRFLRRIRTYTVLPLSYRLRYGKLGVYLAHSCYIPGWMLEEESVALAEACYNLPDDAVILEIGSFVGKSAVLLAGARKLRGSGKVHCVDPFDASGDDFSVPFYQRVARRRQISLLAWFHENMRRCEVSDWVTAYKGGALDIAPTWNTPLDLLFLDGDQSPEGARATYEAYAPFLKPGGVIALHNTAPRDYDPGHDGNRRVVLETIREPEYVEIRQVQGITFAHKAGSTVPAVAVQEISSVL
jgi:predicted O-methyltransferase YrrM